jgi:DNA replication protein DnaC
MNPLLSAIPGALPESNGKPCSVCGNPPERKPLLVIGSRSYMVPVVCHHETELFDASAKRQARQARRDSLLGSFGVSLPPRLHADCRLTQLRTDIEGQEEAMALAGQFVSEASRHLMAGDGMFFTGTPGNGKSALSRAIAGDLEAEGWFVIWLKAKALGDRMWDSKDRMALVRAIEVADLLVVDEAVFESENRHTVGALFTVIDARYEAGKSTILTSNFEKKDLADHYNAVLCRGPEGETTAKAAVMVDRFISRLQPPRYQQVLFTGDDLRVANRRNWSVLPGGGR